MKKLQKPLVVKTEREKREKREAQQSQSDEPDSLQNGGIALDWDEKTSEFTIPNSPGINYLKSSVIGLKADLENAYDLLAPAYAKTKQKQQKALI